MSLNKIIIFLSKFKNKIIYRNTNKKTLFKSITNDHLSYDVLRYIFIVFFQNKNFTFSIFIFNIHLIQVPIVFFSPPLESIYIDFSPSLMPKN